MSRAAVPRTTLQTAPLSPLTLHRRQPHHRAGAGNHRRFHHASSVHHFTIHVACSGGVHDRDAGAGAASTKPTTDLRRPSLATTPKSVPLMYSGASADPPATQLKRT